jgi:hypothetical protein
LIDAVQRLPMHLQAGFRAIQNPILGEAGAGIDRAFALAVVEDRGVRDLEDQDRCGGVGFR